MNDAKINGNVLASAIQHYRDKQAGRSVSMYVESDANKKFHAMERDIMVSELKQKEKRDQLLELSLLYGIQRAQCFPSSA
jgi:hypothetical protein